jgi:hypothetical protein
MLIAVGLKLAQLLKNGHRGLQQMKLEVTVSKVM